MISFLEKYPDVSRIDALKSEPEKREFVLAFREIIRGKIEAQIYEEYEADDPYFIMSEQEYMDFRSKYLDIAIGHTGDKQRALPTLHKPRSNTKISTTWISVWSCSTATSSMSPTFWR